MSLEHLQQRTKPCPALSSICSSSIGVLEERIILINASQKKGPTSNIVIFHVSRKHLRRYPRKNPHFLHYDKKISVYFEKRKFGKNYQFPEAKTIYALRYSWFILCVYNNTGTRIRKSCCSCYVASKEGATHLTYPPGIRTVYWRNMCLWCFLCSFDPL